MNFGTFLFPLFLQFNDLFLVHRLDPGVTEPDLAAFGLEANAPRGVRHVAGPVDRLAVQEDRHQVLVAEDRQLVPAIGAHLRVFHVHEFVQFRRGFSVGLLAFAVGVTVRGSDERVPVESEQMPNILGQELALNARRQEERGGPVFRLGDADEDPAVGLGVVGGVENFGLEDEILVGALGREPAVRVPADLEDAVFQRGCSLPARMPPSCEGAVFLRGRRPSARAPSFSEDAVLQ